MRILHTSDWHLGRTLYGKKRHEEHRQFLEWLNQLVKDERIDVLLVSGDIFDTSTPSGASQRLYYDFLVNLSRSGCSHAVITGGNHDSPAFLNAPKELLASMNIHIVASSQDAPEDEALLLKVEPEGKEPEQLAVCAVPYLRDRDLQSVQPGESLADKEIRIISGIKEHFRRVSDGAQKLIADSGRPAAIVGMAHLFLAGGRTIDGDGVRELHVGSLARLGTDIFPGCIDYWALGHLHVPQQVGGSSALRYCGSPIPMGFGEARDEKQVVLLETSPEGPKTRAVHIPCFQKLEQVSGGLDVILPRLESAVATDEQIWFDIEYKGADLIPNLNAMLKEKMLKASAEILRVRNRRLLEHVTAGQEGAESLNDIDEAKVFSRRLESAQIPADKWPELTAMFHEALSAVRLDAEDADSGQQTPQSGSTEVLA